MLPNPVWYLSVVVMAAGQLAFRGGWRWLRFGVLGVLGVLENSEGQEGYLTNAAEQG